jgi:hypothetical protein
MKALAFLFCAITLLSGGHAISTIAPSGQDCGNGLSCAPSQTCMSNATGAGMQVIVFRRFRACDSRVTVALLVRVLSSSQRGSLQ